MSSVYRDTGLELSHYSAPFQEKPVLFRRKGQVRGALARAERESHRSSATSPDFQQSQASKSLISAKATSSYYPHFRPVAVEWKVKHGCDDDWWRSPDSAARSIL